MTALLMGGIDAGRIIENVYKDVIETPFCVYKKIGITTEEGYVVFLFEKLK